MKKEIIIPRMGESILEAQIGTIFKPSGSEVKVDDEILELETDKVNQVLFAPLSGILTLNVSKGDKVKIDQVIGSVDSEGQTKIQTQKVEPKQPEKEEMAIPATPQEPHDKEPRDNEPPVRILKEDFAAEAAPKPEAIAGVVTRKKMSRLRQTLAARLVEAKAQTAMLTSFNEVDMTEIMALRERHREAFMKKYGVKLGFMPFFVKACISALHDFPLLNASIEGDEIVEKASVDMGIAVSTDRGLIVPVLRNAQSLSFHDIEIELVVLAKKAREGTLTLDEIRGGTFTITNGGTLGSLLSTPILNFPQSGILGMHKIQKRAVVVNDEIVIRSMMYLALTYDHRIVDGKDAVFFLIHLKNMLEDPGRFLIEV